MDPSSQLDPAELMRDAPEVPTTNINHLCLTTSSTASHNGPEVKSIQNLDPAYLDILSHNVRESIVNAVWNQLLREVFEYPGFVLAPQLYTPDNQRVDLVPCAQTYNPNIPLVPMFAYEGKEGPISPTESFKAIV